MALHWFDGLSEEVHTLHSELASPLAAFTGNGTLVLLAENEGRLCEVSAKAAPQSSSFAWPGKAPIAVVRADGSNQFAVFSADGKVQVFRL